MVSFFVGECCVGSLVSILHYLSKRLRGYRDKSGSQWSSLTRDSNISKSSISIDKYWPLMLVLCYNSFVLNASSSRKIFCFHDFLNNVLMWIKHCIFKCFLVLWEKWKMEREIKKYRMKHCATILLKCLHIRFAFFVTSQLLIWYMFLMTFYRFWEFLIFFEIVCDSNLWVIINSSRSTFLFLNKGWQA